MPWWLIALLASGCVAVKPGQMDTIAIQGTPEFKQQVVKALVLLKTKTPEAYGVATNHVSLIQQGKHSGMRAELSRPRFDLNDTTAFYSVTWCAGAISHDSFHSKLYHDYLNQHPKARRVPENVWQGERAERECLAHQLGVLKQLGAPVHEIEWLGATNRYWEVKYRNRNW